MLITWHGKKCLFQHVGAKMSEWVAPDGYGPGHPKFDRLVRVLMNPPSGRMPMEYMAYLCETVDAPISKCVHISMVKKSSH